MSARILIVEDEQIIAADLRNKVKRLGHEVVGIAIGGAEAITMAQQLRPDLVLMDVQLDGPMSGAEAARIIHESTRCSVVFVTAFPEVFVRDPAQMVGPGICISKPFSKLQLEMALTVVLSSRMSGSG
jgi:CheY-like chemotaxis protein